MSSLNGAARGERYWRSLDELADTPRFREFVERGFPSVAEEMLAPASRRHFLTLMGASMALAGLAGCRWPKEEILPYTQRPEGRLPGVPVLYATSMERSGVAIGLLVKSYDGRPIKIEGNPQHPGSLGATDALAQASVLELYDPDRSRLVVRREGGREVKSGWGAFSTFAGDHFAALRAARGRGLRVLTEQSSSPSLDAMRQRLASAFPESRWHEYEPISHDNEREGLRLAFGRPYRAHLLLDRAQVIVSLDADFLMTHPGAVRWARDFASKRRADDGRMSRLYVAESALTVTGANADHRFPMRASDVARFARRLGAELARTGFRAPELTPGLADALAAGAGGEEFPFAAAIARDLARLAGRSLVVAGPRQPAEVHAACHFLNAALSNAGNTVHYFETPGDRVPHADAIRELAGAIRAGEVDTLLVLGGNPVFDAPADLEFRDALKSVKTIVRLALHDDETSRASTWHLPRAHYLESWGDARAHDGTIGITQPLIEPLYGGKTPVELLALCLGDDVASGHEIVRRTFREMLGESGDVERLWRRALHDGVVPNTAHDVQRPRLDETETERAIRRLSGEGPSTDDGMEVVFTPDHTVFDGRFANNPWLQELPDPMTKIAWDNAALLAPATAARLGADTGEIVRLERGGRSIEMVVFVMPGQAEGSITVPLGYGRTAGGSVGSGVGFDAYPLRTTDAMHIARGVRVTATGRRYVIATTQDHHAIDAVGMRGREQRLGQLVREGTLAEYLKDPDFAARLGPEHPPLRSLWQEHPYEDRKWGMTVDLAACTGCSACVIACQAENNIPVVGKEQVKNGREMHWIRVDRYFTGSPESPRVAHQPLMCHHCENAPCEQVCPVAATMHDAEGLNVMVYNRCVGVRYCSNNCPYKVRRFNFFNYQKDLPATQTMVYNPDVTVRSRGVMEKCTFCVQRIKAVTIDARNEGRPVRDGEIVPACAQACPTQAIVFGDLNDPESRVRKLAEHRRAYAMLEELNVKPRTRYLARLTNPEAALGAPDGARHGHG